MRRVPSICVPHVADQFYWSRRLHQLGAAVTPLKRTRLSVRRLARRLEAALRSPKYSERARTLGSAMGAEDGPVKAAALLEERFDA